MAVTFAWLSLTLPSAPFISLLRLLAPESKLLLCYQFIYTPSGTSKYGLHFSRRVEDFSDPLASVQGIVDPECTVVPYPAYSCHVTNHYALSQNVMAVPDVGTEPYPDLTSLEC